MIAKNPRLRLLLGLVFAGLILTIVTGLSPNEPRFEGKRLSFWLEQYRSNLIPGGNAEGEALHDEAKSAIRQIGSNAIPYLLKMLGESDSRVVKWLDLIKVRKFFNYAKPAWVRNSEAMWGFQLLGVDAKGAVPALIEIYQHNLSPSSRSGAAEALGAIGPLANAAIPSLLSGATNSQDTERIYAIDALGQIHGDSDKVVPTLMECLKDKNAGVRAIAVRSLEHFGSSAHQAIPELTKLLEDRERYVRKAAEQAMKQIGP